MVVFIASTAGLRFYIAVLTSTGYTYGALATPIAFLLFAFLLGLSIVLGAHLNNAIDEEWHSRPDRGERRSERLRAAAKRRLPERGRDGAPAPEHARPAPPAAEPPVQTSEAPTTAAAKEPG
jgi:membrane protein